MHKFIFSVILLIPFGCNSDTPTQSKTISDSQKTTIPSGEVVKSDAPSKVIDGTVVSVTDGDTLVVLDDKKVQHKIRLDGIDTPERGQAFGSKAGQALSEKVFNKRVRVNWKERGRYKRIIGSIYLDDRFINIEMVEEGWAWHYKQYSDDKNLAAAENRARAEKRGLWADSKPIPPWDYRRGNQNSGVVSDQGNSSSNSLIYVTKSGKKYHRGSCRHLRKSRIPIPLAKARQRYSPCKVCNPPR